MKKLPYIFSYFVLAIVWCVAYYHFIAPVKDNKLILLLAAGTLFYSLIWALFISLFQKMIGWKGYGMLLIPIGIMFVFILGVDTSTFVITCGLVVISELVSLAKIMRSK
jgi:hypothetical protein